MVVIRNILLIALILVLFTDQSFGQCFSSPGNPIGGTANMGTVRKKILRVSGFYKFHYADHYLNGSEPSDLVYYHDANFSYIGNSLGYGITDKFTAETEFGYFINKTIRYDENYYNPHVAGTIKTGKGLSNMVVSLKHRIYKNEDKRFEWVMAAGGKVPFSTEAPMQDGVMLPVDIRPSTGSYGYVIQNYLIKENSFTGIRFFLINRFEYNFMNEQDYKFGSQFMNSLFFSKHLWFPWTKGDGLWTAIVQLRNDIRHRSIENGLLNDNTGGYMFYVAPQLNLTLARKWNISIMADIPVYQYYNGTQLASRVSVLFNITRDFIFNKEIREFEMD
ncbi:MAG: hypothetical protein ABIJ16_04505 [Bacteroidota bacterium]